MQLSEYNLTQDEIFTLSHLHNDVNFIISIDYNVCESLVKKQLAVRIPLVWEKVYKLTPKGKAIAEHFIKDNYLENLSPYVGDIE